ncbi:MAG: transporter substrate-binding domain-containing protein [Bacteroidia bacterium]|nr:transporter substrate-binding domain-containing protein [Bacteroidia bacterium]
MKKKISIITLLLLSVLGIKSQKPDTLNVNYYENYPFAYTESGTLVGIEIDIIHEYVAWLKKKGVDVVVNYNAIAEFSAFYNSVKNGNSKTIGLGSVTSNSDREKELLISPPYMQNVAVLVSAGSVPTIKSKTNPEVENVLGKLSAVVVKGSSHEKYLKDIKEKFVPGLKITQVETQSRILESIISNAGQFGYVDIIAYWAFLKKNNGKYIKMQKVFNEPKEYLGFIMPKSSVHSAYINEFFESGFGFTATKMYHQILEKYLGYEIIESVELK